MPVIEEEHKKVKEKSYKKMLQIGGSEVSLEKGNLKRKIDFLFPKLYIKCYKEPGFNLCLNFFAFFDFITIYTTLIRSYISAFILEFNNYVKTYQEYNIRQ